MNRTFAVPSKISESVTPLTAEEERKIDAYWRAANYLSVGQIYLRDNALLREPLEIRHIKPRLLGHWGTTPGLNFIYAHFNRIIKKHNLNVIFVAGRVTEGPHWLQTRIWKERTARSTRISRRTRKE
jgi:xylulose-5-phosphate/fructose-6-phosphate phosphoketolase